MCGKDLVVANRVKNRRLSQSIRDASWGMFGTVLSYKAEWRGKHLIRIGRFDGGSKLQPGCGEGYFGI